MQTRTLKAFGLATLAAIALGAAPAGAQSGESPPNPGPPTGDSQGKQPLRCPGKAVTPVRDRAIRGLPVKDARRFAEGRGCDLRVVKRDGRNLIVTDDFSRERVNVAIRDGLIVRVTGIY